MATPGTTRNDSHNGTQGNGEPRELTKTPAKYLHVRAVHFQNKISCLSNESETSPSFMGFRNLMVLVLIVMNLRLVIENFMRYGVLICIRCHDYSRQDLFLGLVLYAMVPCHLYLAYAIELAAAKKAKEAVGRAKKDDHSSSTISSIARPFQTSWLFISLAHGVNATLALLITTGTVFYFIHHPLIGTISELHAIIVWLKICSYAFTNRDLRYVFLKSKSTAELPSLYSNCPYPSNITVGNLSYFWWAPTLIYQPVYPRTSVIRWAYVLRRLAECFSLSIFVWLASAQVSHRPYKRFPRYQK